MPSAPVAGAVDEMANSSQARREFDNEGFEWSRELSRTLERVFGHRQFRQNQRAIVNATMSQRDVFVIMPTGGGKSLCYQLPAMLEDGLTVVVCPLISLIQDQVQAMIAQGVQADFLSGQQSQDQSSAVFSRLWRSDVGHDGLTLLYVTPERIVASPGFTKALHALHARRRLKRFVVDEAHCVSHWGHDFRPDYIKLASLRATFSDVPILALTATATPRVKLDCMSILGLRSPCCFQQSFNRPNLWYQIIPKKKNCTQDMAALLREHHANHTGIIYCCSKKDCEDVAKKLRDEEGQPVESAACPARGRRPVRPPGASWGSGRSYALRSTAPAAWKLAAA